MAIQFQRVAPGNLITADWMNTLIKQLEGMDRRLSDLEQASPGQGKVEISELRPEGSLHVGDELTVIGVYFSKPANSNMVSLDGTLIEIFFNPGCDEQHLVFNIPPVASTPKEVTLTVRNVFGTDSTTLTVLAEQQIPEGEIIVTPDTTAVGTPKEDTVFVVEFELDAHTDIAETFRLSPQFANATGADIDAWRKQTVLADKAGAPLKTEFLRLDPFKPVTIQMQVRVPVGAKLVDLGLKASSLNNPSDPRMNRVSVMTPVKVGTPQPVNSDNVKIDLQKFGSASKGRIVSTADGDTIEIPYGSQALVKYIANFKEGGDYAFTAQVEPSADSLWSHADPSPAQVASAIKDSNQPLGLTLKCLANEDPTGGHAEKRFLVVMASRTTTDPIGQTKSWTRHAIRGYKP